MSEQDKPKECPFCGETAELFGIGSSNYCVVQCDICEAESCGATEQEALDNWNKRACPKELKEAYEKWERSQPKDRIEDWVNVAAVFVELRRFLEGGQ